MADEVEPPEEGGGEEEVEGGEVVPADNTPKVPSLRYCYSIALLAGEGVKLDDLKVLDQYPRTPQRDPPYNSSCWCLCCSAVCDLIVILSCCDRMVHAALTNGAGPRRRGQIQLPIMQCMSSSKSSVMSGI